MNLFEARRLAVTLMHRYGVGSWRLEFGRAKTSSGSCRHDRRTIVLSAPLVALMDESEVTETVLHEIAHALVGPTHGHDEAWREVARKIGATGRVSLHTAAAPAHDWVGTCPQGHRAERHRRPAHPMSCGECGSGFDIGSIVTWRYKGRDVPMTPAYRAEEAALRAAAVSLPQGA
ncbi:SprT-like domain-containing protein [Serinibacter arcticus]|nr:SprT-like domain-containing protein [Serinibacter arcticus]